MSTMLPARAYQASSALTASPAQLVVQLYDGAGRFLRQGAIALADGDIPRASERLGRGEAIIDELLAVLDLSAGEVAEHLQSLYLFSKRELFEARLARDAERVGPVIDILAELRSGWAEIARAA
jgi:flagellar protein FliS